MTPEQIARVCHEINRAYCEAMGDPSKKPWEESPDSQRQSAANGVKYAIEHPEVTPEEMHANWLKEKVQDGWVHGPIKDPDKKEHPCIVPYEMLPQVQQVKDHLFRATVRALSGGPS